MTTKIFLSKTKSPVTLTAEIARGGEGAIHLIAGASDQVAKLYLSAPTAERVGKLHVMAQATSTSLNSVAAWPSDVLIDIQGHVLGFVMPKIGSASQAHELYTPRSRAQAFPEADFKFLLHVAANIVRAFGAVHQAGYVIGDVNHGHLLVGKDGRVALIDCDSFQVEADGRVYYCDVGVPLFTPPELQGRAFRGLMRTLDHDRFGLAVLLFQLLFMGRHPYAGVPLNANQSTDIEAAITANRFAYGKDRRQLGIDQPPGTLPLSVYGPAISALFERAFASARSYARPDESTWLNTLKALQGNLTACGSNPAHTYPSHLNACPWCAIELQTGARLFGARVAKTGAPQTLDIAALWAGITAVPLPTASPSPVLGAAPPRSESQKKRRLIRDIRRAVAIVAAMIFVLIFLIIHQTGAAAISGVVSAGALWPYPNRKKLADAKSSEMAARKAFEAAQRRWTEAANGEGFKAVRARCETVKAELEALPGARLKRLAAVNAEARQKELFLDSFRIGREKIPGIGPGKTSTLASFGIETALDVTAYRIQSVPGFGPATADKLLAWRAAKERQFRFNPNHPATLAETRAIEAEFAAKTMQLANLLRSAPQQLNAANGAAAQVMLKTGPELKVLWVDWKVAQRRRQDLS